MYFTHCQLQPAHETLTLKTAAFAAHKLKNYKDAGSFARRLVDLGLANSELATKCKKIIQVSDKDPTNAVKLDYDSLNPFSVAGDTFVPIYKGKPSVKCSYCGAVYQLSSKDKLCNVCNVGVIGQDASGMRFKQIR